MEISLCPAVCLATRTATRLSRLSLGRGYYAPGFMVQYLDLCSQPFGSRGLIDLFPSLGKDVPCVDVPILFYLCSYSLQAKVWWSCSSTNPQPGAGMSCTASYIPSIPAAHSCLLIFLTTAGATPSLYLLGNGPVTLKAIYYGCFHAGLGELYDATPAAAQLHRRSLITVVLCHDSSLTTTLSLHFLVPCFYHLFC